MADGIILLSTTSLANILGMDRSYVVRLSEQGVLPKRTDGKFDAVKTLSKYCRHLRSKLAGRENNPKDELLRLRAIELDLRIEERLKHLIPITSAMDTIDLLCGMFKSRLVGMPASATRDIHLRKNLEDFVDNLLHDLANECDRAAKALGSGIDIFEDGYAEATEPIKHSIPKVACQTSRNICARGPYRKRLKEVS